MGLEDANPYIAGGKVVLGLIQGFGQRAKANQLERNNPFPTMDVNENIVKNVALAENNAKVGLPQSVYNNAFNKIKSSESAGARMVGRMGTLGSVSTLAKGTQSSILELDARDADAKRQAQTTLMQARGQLANEQQKAFQWNKAQPYLRNLEMIQQLRNAGTQNIFGGISAGLDVFTKSNELKSQNELYAKMLGKG